MDVEFAAADHESVDDEWAASAVDRCDNGEARDVDSDDDDNYSDWIDSTGSAVTDCRSCCLDYCHSPKLLAVIDSSFVAIFDASSTDYPIS